MRAYQLNLEKFGTQVINFFPITSKEKLAEVNHYEEFIAKMKTEGIEEKGHLAETNVLVATLSELHNELKKSDENYHLVYQKVLPFIAKNIAASEGAVKDEIQICLNGVYGFFLLKIQERNISPEDQTMVNSFGDLLSLLNFKYQERKNNN